LQRRLIGSETPVGVGDGGGNVAVIDFLFSLDYPTWYLAWDDGCAVIQACADFVVEPAMWTFRPTRLRHLRLKL
jgi:hypothetical protein